MPTVSSVEATIKSFVNSSGNLLLPADAFGSSTMEAAFHTFLAGVLVVESAQITAGGTSVTVTGQGPASGDGPFPNFSLTAVFTPSDADVAMALTGPTPANWIPGSFLIGLPAGLTDAAITVGNSLSLNTVAVGDTPAGISFVGNFTPDWTLDVGPLNLTVTKVGLVIAWAPGATGPNGSVSGTLDFNNSVTFDVTLSYPGAVDIEGTIPTIPLSALIAQLVNIDTPLPSGFDLTITDGAVSIKAASSDSTLDFDLTATVNIDSKSFPAAFEALKTGGKWGFGAGVSFGSFSLADVPGLSAIAPFVSFFSFNGLVFVVASSDFTDFNFPGASVKLPPGKNVVAGLNAYASIDLGAIPPLKILQTLPQHFESNAGNHPRDSRRWR